MSTKLALVAIALASLFGAKAVASPTPAGSFGNARPGGIEVNLGGGTMRQIACAPGARPGSTCYVAK